MADYLQHLLVAIKEVEELTFFKDQNHSFVPYMRVNCTQNMLLGQKIVEMRDYLRLDEAGPFLTSFESQLYVLELFHSVRSAKSFIHPVSEVGLMMAVIVGGHEEYVYEIVRDLDRWSKQVHNTIITGNMTELNPACDQLFNVDNKKMTVQAYYEGFEELLQGWKEVSDSDLNALIQNLEEQRDFYATSCGSEKINQLEVDFIAYTLQKLTGTAVGAHPFLATWTDSVHGEVVGQGTFGSVLKFDLFGESWALKSLQSVQSSEVKIQATLHHPHIVEVFCCLQEKAKEKCYLLMELMNSDLQKCLKRQYQQEQCGLPLHTAVTIIFQIAQAMRYLHRREVAHRDLKCANVLLKGLACGLMSVKVGDFGLAHQGLSAKGENVGTPRYRAPEITRNPHNEVRDLAKADVYSFAMTSYEIVMCKPPFANIRKDELEKHVVDDGRRPQFDGLSNCPAALISLIAACWEADPLRRPGFEEICDNLQQLQLDMCRLEAACLH